MNISTDLLDSPIGFDKLVSRPRVGSDEGKGNPFGLVTEKEKQQEDSAVGGFSIPNEMTEEERARVESLKALAQQIASQADGSLDATQAARIKDIQKEIGKITKMPMGENLLESARRQAQANRLEKELQGGNEDDAAAASVDDAMSAEENDPLGLAGQPGKQMLHQKAFVTSVRTAGPGLSASSLKSRA
ncbi:MAG: hypothetical protein AB7E51_18750 [Pseudodesulfovibrio sp.]|uniref:hypothetical protein n=1 Tax=Pseudodesulfovibrio sp. TaxID=2035812 RepID=UPI003D107911